MQGLSRLRLININGNERLITLKLRLLSRDTDLCSVGGRRKRGWERERDVMIRSPIFRTGKIYLQYDKSQFPQY